jgi:hypothetical protein
MLSAIVRSVPRVRTIREESGIMYINYDMARALLEERRQQAKTTSMIRQRAPKPTISRAIPEADVIELTFGTHCESGQIGA